MASVANCQGEEGILPLWLSSRKPFRPVKLVTLEGWLRKAMQQGGVDLDEFKAHSVRAAALAHLRKNKNLSTTQVLARGVWKASADGSSRTFLRFYERVARDPHENGVVSYLSHTTILLSFYREGGGVLMLMCCYLH